MTAEKEAVIERFYGAFAQRDGAGMAACYAPDVRFSDPVFTDLRGPEAGAMWRMLTERGSGLLLGWAPLLRNAVRRRARAGLDEFQAREG